MAEFNHSVARRLTAKKRIEGPARSSDTLVNAVPDTPPERTEGNDGDNAPPRPADAV